MMSNRLAVALPGLRYDIVEKVEPRVALIAFPANSTGSGLACFQREPAGRTPIGRTEDMRRPWPQEHHPERARSGRCSAGFAIGAPASARTAPRPPPRTAPKL